MRGFLLDRETDAPIQGATVTLAAPVNGRNAWEREQLPKALDVKTDLSGAFLIPIPVIGWIPGGLYSCSAKFGETRVFSGYVSLQQTVVLRANLPHSISGRLLSYPDFEYSKVSVMIETRDDKKPATAKLDPFGRFQSQVSSLVATEFYDLSFWKEGVLGSFSASVAVSDLSSAQGATIEAYPVRLNVLCKDIQGTPIRSAKIRVGLVGGENLGLQDHYSDESGMACIFVDRGENQVCVANATYWTYLALVWVPDGIEVLSHEVTLLKQDKEAHVQGMVVSPERTPVAGAFVSCLPVGPEKSVSIAGMCSAKSDEAGRFEFDYAIPGSIEIKAFHRRYGYSEPKRIDGDEHSVVELAFGLSGSVYVDVEFSDEPLEFFSGEPEYYLIDRYAHRSFSGHCRPPIIMADIPKGEYNLYVRLPGSAGYFQAPIAIESGKERRVRAPIDPGYWYEGDVTTHGGGVEGLLVRVRNSDWPEEIVRGWGTSSTSRGGKFKVFGGQKPESAVEVIERGEVVETFEVRAGTNNRLRLDSR